MTAKNNQEKLETVCNDIRIAYQHVDEAITEINKTLAGHLSEIDRLHYEAARREYKRIKTYLDMVFRTMDDIRMYEFSVKGVA